MYVLPILELKEISTIIILAGYSFQRGKSLEMPNHCVNKLLLAPWYGVSNEVRVFSFTELSLLEESLQYSAFCLPIPVAAKMAFGVQEVTFVTLSPWLLEGRKMNHLHQFPQDTFCSLWWTGNALHDKSQFIVPHGSQSITAQETESPINASPPPWQ